METLLHISGLKVQVENKIILNGIDLTINTGSTHVIMGPNGSGKSTLSYALMGHPAYTVINGSAHFLGKNLFDLPVHHRAKAGLFLAFQYPYEIDGVLLKDFLRQAYNALYGGTSKQLGLKAFRMHLESKMELLGITSDFIERPVNVGCSGGEKKRAEMLQLAVLEPRLAILDEIDSGLDIDALKIVASSLDALKKATPSMGLLIITHYQRILNHITPDFVHVMQAGRIVQSGNAELALYLEQHGYNPTEQAQ